MIVYLCVNIRQLSMQSLCCNHTTHPKGQLLKAPSRLRFDGEYRDRPPLSGTQAVEDPNLPSLKPFHQQRELNVMLQLMSSELKSDHSW